MNVGGVRSTFHVTALEIVLILSHPSFAVNVLICVREHAKLETVPSLNVIVGMLQASVAVASPSAASISLDAGLQPILTSVYVPVKEGGVRSEVHVAVLDTVDVLPQ